jgi:hypothetical protein
MEVDGQLYLRWNLNVSLEYLPGEEVICIQAFHASPDGEGFSWQASREFHVGERLRFLGSRQNPHLKDRPNGWLVIIETADSKRYAATQTYFVTEECWRGIEQFFCQVAARAENQT